MTAVSRRAGTSGGGVFRPISGDGEVPDRELRDLCIFWVRAIQSDSSDQAALVVEELATRILETPATCRKGVFYKVAAAAATAAFKQLGDDHPVCLFLMSAIEDNNRLCPGDLDAIERPADQGGAS